MNELSPSVCISAVLSIAVCLLHRIAHNCFRPINHSNYIYAYWYIKACGCANVHPYVWHSIIVTFQMFLLACYWHTLFDCNMLLWKFCLIVPFEAYIFVNFHYSVFKIYSQFLPCPQSHHYHYHKNWFKFLLSNQPLDIWIYEKCKIECYWDDNSFHHIYIYILCAFKMQSADISLLFTLVFNFWDIFIHYFHRSF
jgi:hypothetical protein